MSAVLASSGRFIRSACPVLQLFKLPQEQQFNLSVLLLSFQNQMSKPMKPISISDKDGRCLDESDWI